MKSKSQDILCACFDITKTEVRNFLSKEDANIEDLYSNLKVGSKCTACLADLDLLLSESQNIDSPYEEREQTLSENFEIEFQGTHPDERLDSGIFLCENDINTSLQLANYNPLFRDTNEAVDHAYHVRLFSESGKITSQTRGIAKVGETLSIDFSSLKNCPNRGWFLISLIPSNPGFYGTLRPQILLKGNNWALTSHVQPHIHATYGPSRQPRRAHMYIKSVNGKTNTALSVINAANKKGNFTIELTEDAYKGIYNQEIEPNGSAIVYLDNKINNIPKDAVLLIAVSSSVATRKHILMESENGTLSMDHFPNTV